MNILLLGSGGREHALAWGISKSPLLNKLYIAPGNPGTSELGENVDLSISDFDAIWDFIQQKDIAITVVGPEQPLVDGIADFLVGKGHKVFGPKKSAAILEGSKEYSKDFMQRQGIPTAAYKVFNQDEFDDAVFYIIEQDRYPVVLKADGLAGGKGVFICDTEEDAVLMLNELRKGSLSEASQRLVIEEFMEGEEASVFVITDGNEYKIIGNAQDHKRVGEGDTGLNTGGMGAYSPAPIVTPGLLAEIEEKIIAPTVHGMREEGNPYEGILYVGLMITSEGPKVVEYNCRFGDPECQVIVPALESDLLETIQYVVNGDMASYDIKLDDQYRCTVVLASEGYPGSYEKGKVITGLDTLGSGDLFHAGTKSEDGSIKTNGGRVLNVIGSGATLHEAISNSYKNVEKIHFDKAYYRRDIGAKGLKHLE